MRFSIQENVLMAIEIVLRFSLSFSKLENEQNQEQNELLYYWRNYLMISICYVFTEIPRLICNFQKSGQRISKISSHSKI
jgi:hypothetical protein